MDPHVWDRFDMVAVVTYTGYRDTRVPALRTELERVGLLDKVKWFWGFDSPFWVRLANSLRCHSSIPNMRVFGSVLEYYRVLKTALELGYQSVLVLEDDVRFLTDTDLLARVISVIPEDSDMAKLEWVEAPVGKHTVTGDSGRYWVPLRGFNTVCDAAVAYSARGLKWKVEEMEAPARYENLHSLLFAHDVYDNDGTVHRGGIHAYVATPVAAVQALGVPAMHAVRRSYDVYGSHVSGMSYGGDA